MLNFGYFGGDVGINLIIFRILFGTPCATFLLVHVFSLVYFS